MNVVRINSKNVIFLFMALLSTSVQEARMDYGTATSYALKEANVNSTPAYSSKKEEMAGLCPSGTPCIELSGECLKCNLNYSCKYGSMYEANCSVMEHVDCIGEQTFMKKYICRYCYQTDHWEHQCHQKNSCSSVASPQQYYRTNCTVNDDILCLGRRKFMKNLPCNWTVGYRWSTALILSITLGGFGADRFYLGHWQEGIALDVSLSMRRVLTSGTSDNLQNELSTRHHLAVHGINALLHYLQINSKLEFVSLIVFSSLYEVVCPFTRDYDSIRAKLQTIEEWDKTYIEGALHGVNNVIMAEWGNTTACQVILITDGNPGVGPMSLGHSLSSLNIAQNINPFPLPFPYPGKLSIVCIGSQQDSSLQIGLPLYQRLVDLAGGDSIVLVPESPLNKYSVAACFQKVAESNYVSFQGYLKCGHLGSRVLLSPAPMPYTKKTDFELAPGLAISKTMEICGFISVGDVGSPNSISRHLVLPLATEKNSSMQGISLEEDSDTDENGDEGKMPSFCVLLHGALKVENMAALCMLNNDWYGFIYSWADTKKKSNLMLTVLEPGYDVVPWLGNFSNLGPLDSVKSSPVSFPVRPTEKRSYTQNAPSWIRQVGLQSDIQKILRHARKLPDKTQNFYKEVNRLRRAAASIGFIELLEGLACILERECTLLPPNLNPDCTIQMGHVASMIRKPEFHELRYNIPPARTKFQPGS